MDEIDSPAEFYRPSGRVAPVRFAVALPFAAAAALAVGYGLCKLFHNGLYFLVVVPLVAGCVVGGAAAAAVSVGHCRNRVVAAAVGLALGAGMFAGYYQFDMCRLIGWRNAHRVDMLPDWVRFRVDTDEVADVGRPNRQAGGPGQAIKWAMFAGDALAAVLPAAAIGWGAAGRAYSERHRRWMAAHALKLADGSGQPVVDAVLAADPAAAAAAHVPAAANVPAFDQLTVDYLPNEPDSPVFVTLAFVTGADNPKTTRTRTAFARRVLTADQARALATAIAVPRAGFGAPPEDRRAAASGPAGRVFELPDTEAAGLLRAVNRYASAAVAAAPLLALLTTVAGFGAAGYLAWDDLDVVGRAALVAAGAVAVGLIGWLGARYEHHLPAGLHRRRLDRAVAARPDPLVDPTDPTAWFVERVPRANWARAMVENADEMGLLKVDGGRGLLVYEGDRERWVIPAEALTGCQVEEFTAQGTEENAFSVFAAVVVRATVDGAAWEAPLVVKPVAWRPWLRAERRRLAAGLAADIQAILPADRADG